MNFVEILTLLYTPSWAPIHLSKLEVGHLWGKIWAILSPGDRCLLFLFCSHKLTQNLASMSTYLLGIYAQGQIVCR